MIICDNMIIKCDNNNNVIHYGRPNYKDQESEERHAEKRA